MNLDRHGVTLGFDRHPYLWKSMSYNKDIPSPPWPFPTGKPPAPPAATPAPPPAPSGLEKIAPLPHGGVR